eukprot:3265162-Rhodomonas_salina.2
MSGKQQQGLQQGFETFFSSDTAVMSGPNGYVRPGWAEGIQFIAQVSSIFPLELERKRKSEVKQKAEESESESEEEKQEEVSNTFVPNFRA